jgi:hypothetical protein
VLHGERGAVLLEDHRDGPERGLDDEGAHGQASQLADLVMNRGISALPRPRVNLRTYGGWTHPTYTLRSLIRGTAYYITREVLPETYFLFVIMVADAQAGPFLQFQASC